jgi:hypothetical protein
MHITFITCAPEKLNYYFPTEQEPELIPTEAPFTPDDQLAVDYLRAQGYQVSFLNWREAFKENTDLSMQLTSSLKEDVLYIMRSPWDYMDSSDLRFKFQNWLQGLTDSKIKMANSASFMSWLLDKSYLKDLENAGIAIVPTKIVYKNSLADILSEGNDFAPSLNENKITVANSDENHIESNISNEKPKNNSEDLNLSNKFTSKYLNQHLNLADELKKHPSGLILKPAMAAAGRGLIKISDINEAKSLQNKFKELTQSEKYLVQPLLKSIQTEGEWSLIFIAGNYSHAVHKAPARGEILVQAECGGSLNFIEPPADLLTYATKVYKKIIKCYRNLFNVKNYIPLYLRCDFIQNDLEKSDQTINLTENFQNESEKSFDNFKENESHLPKQTSAITATPKAQYLLSECEGIEPELFFRVKPEISLALFSEGVANLCA